MNPALALILASLVLVAVLGWRMFRGWNSWRHLGEVFGAFAVAGATAGWAEDGLGHALGLSLLAAVLGTGFYWTTFYRGPSKLGTKRRTPQVSDPGSLSRIRILLWLVILIAGSLPVIAVLWNEMTGFTQALVSTGYLALLGGILFAMVLFRRRARQLSHGDQ